MNTNKINPLVRVMPLESTGGAYICRQELNSTPAANTPAVAEQAA